MLEIYKVVKVNRFKRDKTFIFVGMCPSYIQSILQKYQMNHSVSKAEEKNLKEYFNNDFKQIYEHKTKLFEYIFINIFQDDSIYKIKQKILAFMSSPTENKYFYTQNQELFCTVNQKTLVLGTFYETLEHSVSINDKIKNDKIFVDKSGESVVELNLYQLEDLTLYDSVNGEKIENNILYLHLLDEELDFLASQKKAVDDFILNGYILKYWPLGLIEGNKSYGKDRINKLKASIMHEQQIEDIVSQVEPNINEYTPLSIIQVHLLVRSPLGYDFVDLLKIFTFLEIDEKTPFKRYKDPEWTIPYVEVYEPLVKKGILTKKQLKEWVINKKVNKETKMKEVKYTARGLTLKRFLYQAEDGPKYATINIHRTGALEIRMSFREQKGANLLTIKNALDDITQLIKKINEIDYRLLRNISKTIKIRPPEYLFDEKRNEIRFIKNSNLVVVDAMRTLKNKDIENFKELNQFSYLFTPYLSPILHQKNYEDQYLLSKYKRVSNYSKMNEIYEFIHKTMATTPNISKKTIVELIGENFDKNIDESIKLFKEWDRKYGFLGTISRSSRQTGVDIKVSDKKIMMKSARTIRQLNMVSTFMEKFLHLFWNIDIIRKEKKYRPLFLKIETENNIFFDENSNQNSLYKSLNNVNTFSNLNNDNYANYLVDNTDTQTQTMRSIKKSNINFNVPSNMRESYLASDIDIQKDAKMRCDNRIPEKDICTDFCEDDRYALRRLQRYDNPIFRYRADPKFINYARECQPKDRQPIVMYKNPENDPKIDRKSFTYAIKYGSSPDRQNYYICPRVWCPYEEIPIHFDIVKDKIIKRPTKEGICETAICPSCKKKGITTYLRIIPLSKYAPYPGFVDGTKHPEGFCMPCCQKKPWNIPKSKKYSIFKKCLGEDVENNLNNEAVDYIMGRDKMPLRKNRYGLLPALLSRLFGSKCDTGHMKENTTCFLRYGVRNDDKQSFFEAMVSLAEKEGQPISKQILKDHILKKLTKKIFLSLKQGILSNVFNNNIKEPFELFKEYTKTDDFPIREDYYWDLMQRKGVLFDEGVNIVIFNSDSIICPVGEECSTFYKSKRPYAFIYTDGRYYELLIRLTLKDGKYILEKLFNYDEPITQRILTLATEFCQNKHIINWDEIRKENMGKSFYPVKPENTLKETLKALIKKYKVKSQYMDTYKKCSGIILGNNILIPVLPQKIITKLDYTISYNPVSYDEAIKSYNKIANETKLNIKPLFNILNDKKTKVVAILLENDRIIPIKEIDINKAKKLPNSNTKYYSDVNFYIENNIELEDDRSRIVKKTMFQDETFKRFMFEFGRFIQDTDVKSRILDILKDNDKYQDKRDKLLNLIKKTYIKYTSNKEKQQNYDNYIQPNIRRQCSVIIQDVVPSKKKEECNSNFHCIYDNTGCKLYIPKKDLLSGQDNRELMSEKMTDIILNNKMRGDEIINDKMDDIIDKKKITMKKDAVFLTGATQNILNSINSLYKPPEKFVLNKSDQFDTAEPLYEGINKERYLLDIDTERFGQIKTTPLPNMWRNKLGKDFEMIDENILKNSLFYGIAKIFEGTVRKVTSISDLKSQFLEKISSVSKEDIEILWEKFFNKKAPKEDPQFLLVKLYKEFNGSLYKSINSFSDLTKFILSDDYPVNEIDAYFMSKTLNVNMIILEKRITQINKKGYYNFNERAPELIMMLVTKKFNFKLFNPVIRKNQMIFGEKELKYKFT